MRFFIETENATKFSQDFEQRAGQFFDAANLKPKLILPENADADRGIELNLVVDNMQQLNNAVNYINTLLNRSCGQVITKAQIKNGEAHILCDYMVLEPLTLSPTPV